MGIYRVQHLHHEGQCQVPVRAMEARKWLVGVVRIGIDQDAAPYGVVSTINAPRRDHALIQKNIASNHQ